MIEVLKVLVPSPSLAVILLLSVGTIIQPLVFSYGSSQSLGLDKLSGWPRC